MPNIKNILFPIDFSERCRQIAPIVLAWSKQFDAPITLLHSFSVPYGEREFEMLQAALRKEIQKAAQTRLEEFADTAFPGERLIKVVEEGDPGQLVLRSAKATAGTLVMMPTHGYSGFRRFLIGSVASKVLHDVDCPVWTTPHSESTRGIEPKSPETILCAVDRDRSAVPLIKWAEWLASQYGATLKLVHALPAIDEESDNRGERAVRRHWITRAQQELAPLIVEAGSKAELIMEGGNVPDALASAAAKQNADLLIIGRGQVKKRLGRLRTHSLGIIAKSPCPVLSV